jgi:tetratricopeptide (TPR) repeat protein
MHSSEIVCQVTNQDNQVEFTWSSGGGFFRPYVVAGTQLAELREATRSVRKALEVMVYALNKAGDGPGPWEPAYELAEAGFRLFNYVLPTEDETSRKVRRWLEELRKRSKLIGLEVVLEERGSDPRTLLSMPWNLVYDERATKHKAAFQGGTSVERWRPFWSIRYNLTSCRRVEPLRRLPVWDKPRVIAAISPGVYQTMNRQQQQNLDQFVEAAGLVRVGSLAELEEALEEGYPQLFYYLGHATPDYLTLGDGESITQSDLRNLLRSFDDRERPEGMLAFLNACQTAESGQTGSFLEVLHSFGFTGAIATEQQTIDNFANELGLSFLRGFLNEGQPVGELLHGLRLNNAPLGLLYGAHCPPQIRVRRDGDDADQGELNIHDHGAVAGAMLKGQRLLRAPSVAARPVELPREPYRSLGFYDVADRALFTGRDTDIVRFAATLDEPDARIVILQGESGIGKSSFLRAGVLPYLEEECIGYRLLRRRNDEALIIQVAKDAIGQIAQGLLDATAEPLEYATPDGEQVRINLREPINDVLGRPADYATLRSALAQDASLFSTLLARMAAPLPHALVLFVDQAEEFFTLSRSPEEIRDRDHALKMIQRVVDIKADVKLIITLRTEYYGRLLDHLRAGRRSFSGVRDELLRDFTLPSLVAAIERPTSPEPLDAGPVSPRAKYGFRFADGVAARIALGGLSLRTEHQDSVLPLIQVICTQLYERKKAQKDSDGVITLADLEAIRGVEGGLKAFAEDALERSIGLEPADRAAFKSLFIRLYSRQVDGTLTTWLAPRDALESTWNGSMPFAQVMESARSVRLLREDVLRVEGNEPRPFIRLGHDALARVAAAWQAELDEEERLRQERAQVELERAKRRKQVRKLIIGTALAASAAILFGAIGVWALDQRARARASETRARSSETKALDNEKKAEESLRVACQGLDDLLTDVADVDLADIPQMEPVRLGLLQKAKAGYEKLAENRDAKQSTLLRWVVGRSYSRLGDIVEMMGDYSRSEEFHRQAIGLLAALSADSPTQEGYRHDLLRSQVGLGVLYRKMHRFQEADEQLRAAAANSEPLASSTAWFDREMLAELGYQKGVLWARQAEARGALEARKSELARASEQAYREALGLQEAMVKEQPGRADLRAKLGRYRNNLGKLLGATRRLSEAEAELRAALLLAGESPTLPGERWQSARTKNNLGTLLASQESRAAEGLGLLREARDGLERLTKEFPTIPQYRQELASVTRNLGKALANGQSAQALSDLKEALRIRKQLVEDSPGFPEYRMELAVLAQEVAYLVAARDPAAAETIAREAVSALSELALREPPIPSYVHAVGRAHYELAQLLMIPKKCDQARSAIEQSIFYHRRALELSPENVDYRANLQAAIGVSSIILIEGGETAKAADAAEELPRLMPQDLKSYYNSATLLTKCLRASTDEPQSYGRRAVAILEKAVENGLIKEAKQLDYTEFRALRERDDFRRLRQGLVPSPAA